MERSPKEDESDEVNVTTAAIDTRPSKRRRTGSGIKLMRITGDNDTVQPVILRDASNLLDDILYPDDSATFLRDVFRQSAVHIPAISLNRARILRDELFGLDVKRIFEETASESIFVWLTPAKSAAATATASSCSNGHLPPNNRMIQSIEVADAAAAYALWQAGHTTYCRAPLALEQVLVKHLLRATGLGCGQYNDDASSGSSSSTHPFCTTLLGRGEVEVFCAPQPGHVTDWHFDFQENFTIQLSGRKQWTLMASTIEHPLRACTPHYQASHMVESQLLAAHLADPDFEFTSPPQQGVNAQGSSTQTVVMNAGDVLYFPAGVWHQVETLEAGISINVSLMAQNYANITCQALQHVLLQQSEWRQCIVHNSSSNAVSHLKTLLHKLPAIIRDLEGKGGANAILPPILRTSYQRKDDRIWKSDYIDDCSTLEDEEEEEEEEEEDVLSPPYDALPNEKRHDIGDIFIPQTLVENPLSSLIRDERLTKFYETVNAGMSEDGKDSRTKEFLNSQVYVININYAGNEQHESSLRFRVQDYGGLLRDCERFGSQQALMKRSNVDDPTLHALLDCLIYRGYFVVVVFGEK